MNADDFLPRLESLVRGDGTRFTHFIPRFEDVAVVDGTTTTVSTHFLAHDANGAPAVTLLAEAMAAAAIDFCIPRDRIQAAAAEQARTGSATAFAELASQTRELFVRANTTGEGGELLLFLLMEQLLGLPQILSKMSLKTNSQMHVHGSDGIHAALAGDGILDVYWGESKLYSNSSEAFRDCFESIAPFLATDGDEARKRDLLLVRDHLNVDEVELAARLLEYFDPSDPKRLNVRWNGVCLVGFDRSSYPNVPLLKDEELATLRAAVTRWQNTVKSRVEQHSLQAVRVDLYCLPVPSVEDLRGQVLKALGVKND
ncbi:DUF1837 domain-containing protein [Leifsonia sp. PS1209]|uniref:HamA C-terminal domain-containing protein n=1 Tax=Leifsonia sp. PS1209 TaxID=2724914 RepID=UPI001442AD76|nr:DUF1837 domain-containing protein [Leifsonia sp. PS1209]QIZ99424.1 DUF1837 domain-containing protein [Leifsonia sp. PS1209]